ncbi:hypothetical protein SNEBB_000745 [Seison nebaliae]|nr:hypothetical protein SNEBB_000745 [Seison nebaliae]
MKNILSLFIFLFIVTNGQKYELVKGFISCPNAKSWALSCAKTANCLGFRNKYGMKKLLDKKDIILSTVVTNYYLTEDAHRIRKQIFQMVNFEQDSSLILRMKAEKRFLIAIIKGESHDHIRLNALPPIFKNNEDYNLGFLMLYSFIRTQNFKFTFGCENAEVNTYPNCEVIYEYTISCDGLESIIVGSSNMYWKEDVICKNFDSQLSTIIFVNF